jgi:hypothetical protein
LDAQQPKGEGTMEIDYLDADARRVATTPRHTPDGWSQPEVTRLRLVAQCVRSAVRISDLLTLRCLRLNADDSDEPNRYSSVLSDRRTLTLALKADNSPITAMLDIVPIREDQTDERSRG